VRLSERHLHSDPPTAAEAQSLIADIDAALAGLALPIGRPVVGTAGTATTLAAVECKLRVWDPAAIQGMRVPRVVVERQLARYLELSLAERKRLAGLEPERADVIAAGAALFARLLHHADAPELVVSDRGVRWGVAYELLDQSR
jgi:exopolyphosphatase/guanosine-5'-triphosphate,3'-diphosphate pyrophosphatase